MEYDMRYNKPISEKQKKIRRFFWEKFFANINSDENPESREFYW